MPWKNLYRASPPGARARSLVDDLFYDAGKARIYVLGEGFIDVWRQMNPTTTIALARVATPANSRTGLFV